MNAAYLLLAAVAVVTVVFALWDLFGAWRRAREERLIVCPENRQPAAVCWDCHVVESLYRLHPELVVERPKHWAHYH